MHLKYLYPHWGSEALSCQAFFDVMEQEGFDGIEINMPKDPSFQNQLFNLVDEKRSVDPNFVVMAQQVLGLQSETPEAYLSRVLERLEMISQAQPDVINSHTGKDHYSFSDNCKIIEAVEEFSLRKGIPVYHEIHRGRFTFHSTTTLQYLDVFPQLKFVGDFSHWCVVSESLLQDQEDTIASIMPHLYHIHARVGTEQASQVNHPFAPEWQSHLDRFTQLWKQIVSFHKNRTNFTITPEFGPFPYMPRSPFDQKPLSDQKEINIKMMKYLKTVLS
ncbi:MAG: sugar phosphate isomerase/epimerase [Bacteroidota bacterium]